MLPRIEGGTNNTRALMPTPAGYTVSDSRQQILLSLAAPERFHSLAVRVWDKQCLTAWEKQRQRLILWGNNHVLLMKRNHDTLLVGPATKTPQGSFLEYAKIPELLRSFSS